MTKLNQLLTDELTRINYHYSIKPLDTSNDNNRTSDGNNTLSKN